MPRCDYYKQGTDWPEQCMGEGTKDFDVVDERGRELHITVCAEHARALNGGITIKVFSGGRIRNEFGWNPITLVHKA